MHSEAGRLLASSCCRVSLLTKMSLMSDFTLGTPEEKMLYACSYLLAISRHKWVYTAFCLHKMMKSVSEQINGQKYGCKLFKLQKNEQTKIWVKAAKVTGK